MSPLSRVGSAPGALPPAGPVASSGRKRHSTLQPHRERILGRVQPSAPSAPARLRDPMEGRLMRRSAAAAGALGPASVSPVCEPVRPRRPARLSHARIVVLPFLLLCALLSFSPAHAQSANDLSGLVFSSGGSLSPPFAPATRAYSIRLLYPSDKVVFTPTSTGTITWWYDKAPYTSSTSIVSGAPSPALTLAIGNNVISLKAGSGATYVVTVHRASNDARMGNLLCDAPLSPLFSAATLSYEVLLGSAIATFKCAPTPVHGPAVAHHALDYGTWTPVAHGVQAGRPMAVGDNRLEFRVTAEGRCTEARRGD